MKILSGDAAAVVTHLVTTLNIPAEGLLTGADIAAPAIHAADFG